VKKVVLDPTDVCSYPPISNFSVLSKLLQRLVTQQLMNYLTTADLLHHCNLASALDILLKLPFYMCSPISYRLLTMEAAALVLLDLSAAFNMVDHEILLHHLQTSYGINGSVLQWLRSYLVGRTQHVRCGSTRSSAVHLVYSVPQGLVFGPILFVLYTADLVALVESLGMPTIPRFMAPARHHT